MIRKLGVGLIVAAALLAPAAAEGVATTAIVSVPGAGMEGVGGGDEPSISGDGRFVAFRAGPSSFTIDPPSTCVSYCADIFLKEMQSGAVELISVSTTGVRSNAFSDYPDISETGRFVAFGSNASNLITDDTNVCQFTVSCGDIFLRDLLLDVTERISVSDAEEQGNSGSYDPRISEDGRFVVFVSTSDNLVANDANQKPDVFVRDRQEGTTERVSVSSGGVEANSSNYWPVISGDGSRVAFSSVASNLVPGDAETCGGQPGSCSDIFVHDLASGTTSMATVDSGEVHGDRHSARASISANGRFVAFDSSSTNLVQADLNSVNDVFVRDLVTGSTEILSVNDQGAQGDASSCPMLGAGAWPCIDMSDDGRFVTFESLARNLATPQTCIPVYETLACSQVYVRDRQLGTTMRASVSNVGSDGIGESSWPSMNSDGRMVAFASGAANLVAGDINTLHDVFLHDSGIVDVDGDGVLDVSDNCPAVSNGAGQAADADGDLAGDACDGAGSGNVDCSPPPTGVSSVDALKVLRAVAGLSVAQSEPCLNIGLPRLPPGEGVMGDVNCSGGVKPVNAVDALLILRAVAGIPWLIPPVGCPEVKPP